MAAMHRPTRLLTIATGKEKLIDNETRAGGMRGVETACTSLLPLMMKVYQTCKGTREGSHKADIQLVNYQTVEAHDVAQPSFS